MRINVLVAGMVISSITNLYFSGIFVYRVKLPFRVYSDVVYVSLLLVLVVIHFVYAVQLLVSSVGCH